MVNKNLTAPRFSQNAKRRFAFCNDATANRPGGDRKAPRSPAITPVFRLGTICGWGVPDTAGGSELQQRLAQWLGNDRMALLGGLAAYGSAELAVRLVRLVTVVIIARRLAPEIVGVAALSLSLFELIRVFANIGIGQQIVAARADALDAICNTAHRLFWLWCGGVAAFQLTVAAVLALVFDQWLAGPMLAILAAVYLLMPGGLVQCYLLMRDGQMGVTARTSAIQTIADHVLTAALLLVWPSAWSIILPKLLTAPLWLILVRRARVWHRRPEAGFAPWRTLMHFGLSVLATDFATAMRTQADKLIVGATLGLSALGTYFFAFNAGIGIVSSLLAAFGTVLFPTLCKAPAGLARAQRFRGALVLGICLFVPLIAAQCLLAPAYVPLVFGARWSHAAPLIAILVLAAVPMFLATASTAWLRAEGTPGIDAFASFAACIAALAGLAIGTQYGLTAAAVLWVAGMAIVCIPFAGTVIRRAVKPDAILPNEKALA